MMFNALVGRFLYGAAALCLVAGLAGVWGMARGADKERRKWQEIVLTMERDAATAAAKAREHFDNLERNWRARYEQAVARGERERERANRLAADLARARVERDGLRDQIDAYATRGCESAVGAHAATCERAATLGALLDESMQVQEELGLAAESHASDVRRLQGAWPK